MKKGAWGELPVNAVRCEARARVVTTLNPNSRLSLKPCLANALTANVFGDGWKGIETSSQAADTSLQTQQLYSTLFT